MLYQAHRGVSTEYPENTMPAFLAAIEQGYQVIELDPVFTADGQCVTFHDKTVNRTCRMADGSPIAGTVNVAEISYEQLCTYDAGIFMGEQFRGTRVPLLEQVLRVAAQSEILVKIDNKFERFTLQQQEKLYQIVEASGAKVAFTCQKEETIQQIAGRFSDVQIHYDGYVDKETLRRVKVFAGNHALTVWLALPSPLTAWVKVPTANLELCAMVKRYASLGLWILSTNEQLEQARILGADVIETTGAVKPEYK